MEINKHIKCSLSLQRAQTPIFRKLTQKHLVTPTVATSSHVLLMYLVSFCEPRDLGGSPIASMCLCTNYRCICQERCSVRAASGSAPLGLLTVSAGYGADSEWNNCLRWTQYWRWCVDPHLRKHAVCSGYPDSEFCVPMIAHLILCRFRLCYQREFKLITGAYINYG